jgi:predicted kinase
VRVLVQLSGVPGSGKSTLARALAAELGLVVLDTDVVKSGLLASGVDLGTAGGATYSTVLDVAADLLAQGHAVVVDSPCRYPELLARGRSVAAAAGVRYAFVELRVADPRALLPRLDARTPLPSQVASATDPPAGRTWELGTAEATLAGWQQQLVRPETDCLVVDAERPTADVLPEVVAYIRSPASASSRAAAG